MPTKRSSHLELERRLDEAEAMLCTGLGSGEIGRTLAAKYRVTERQARKYIAAVCQRWQAQAAHDAPFRREKLYHMAEHFYATSMRARQFTAAASALNLLAKLSGAYSTDDKARTELVANLGPVPDDPTQALLYGQRVMLHALRDAALNPTLDPERRLRWITEIGAKLGMTHAKALMEYKLERVTQRMESITDGQPETQPLNGVAKPPTARKYEPS